jgi:hypothetical protein
VKTSPTRSYSVIENERFGLVFAKTRSIISGTDLRLSFVTTLRYGIQCAKYMYLYLPLLTSISLPSTSLYLSFPSPPHLYILFISSPCLSLSLTFRRLFSSYSSPYPIIHTICFPIYVSPISLSVSLFSSPLLSPRSQSLFISPLN